MKFNTRLYNQVDGEPDVIQNMEDGKCCEIFFINDKPCYNEIITQGRFSMWATLDGKTYRLLIEKGYYETVSELYSNKVNVLWMEFWDVLDAIKVKTTFRIILPIMIAYYAILIAVSFFLDSREPGSGTGVILIGGLVGLFVIYFLNSNLLMRKMKAKNVETIQHIKKLVGTKRFEELLEDQKKYVESFYDKRNAEINEQRAKEAAEKNPQELPEEVKETEKESTEV